MNKHKIFNYGNIQIDYTLRRKFYFTQKNEITKKDIGIQIIKKALAKLPKSIFDLMEKTNLKISLLDDYQMRLFNHNDKTSGNYDPINNIIYIMNCDYVVRNRSLHEFMFTSNFYHEIGHFIDRQIALKYNEKVIYNSVNDLNISIAKNKEFDILFKNISNEDYYGKDYIEYFAEGFSRRFMTDNMQEIAPITTMVVDSYIKSLAI